MQGLSVTVCSSPEDAVSKGYNYRAPEYRAARLVKAVVVENGTMQGNATVDLIFEGENGQKYVAMITGALLKMIPL